MNRFSRPLKVLSVGMESHSEQIAMNREEALLRRELRKMEMHDHRHRSTSSETAGVSVVQPPIEKPQSSSWLPQAPASVVKSQTEKQAFNQAYGTRHLLKPNLPKATSTPRIMPPAILLEDVK